MSFTHKSLALVWLLFLGLFGLAGSGVVAGPWLILLIAAALAMPALISGLDSKPKNRFDREIPAAPAGRLATILMRRQG
jgi:hypothetical protein